MTCDEVLLKDKRQLSLRFALSPEYIGHPSTRHPWGIYLGLDNKHLVPVSELGRNVYLVNGILKRAEAGFELGAEIAFHLFVNRSERWLKELADSYPNELLTCLGRVLILSTESESESPAYEVVVHQFESLDLVHGSPTFGQWIAFDSYGRFIADPDVIGGGVLLADVEVLRRID